MRIVLLLLALTLTASCSEVPDTYTNKIVVEIGDCTNSTGGWGGTTGSCRVFFRDGTRVTVYRPVSVGDEVRCVNGKTDPWSCRVK